MKYKTKRNKRIIEYHLAGFSTNQIGRKEGISPTRVSYIIKREKERIMNDDGETKTRRDIKKLTGVSRLLL